MHKISWTDRALNEAVLQRRERILAIKRETLDCPLWRTCFGRGYGPVIRPTR